MKVAIIGSRGYPYVYSGYETLVRELSEGLVVRGIDVTVYCHKPLFAERPRLVNGVNLVYIPTLNFKILSQLSNSFLSVIHACFSSADVVFVVNSANGPWGLITRLFGKKTAINVDGLEWLRPKWRGLGSRYFYFASWLSTKLYDQVINDSEEMRQVYLRLFKKDSRVIAYGAHLKQSTKPELISKWSLQPDGYYLIVGRLIPDNNSDLIVEEFCQTSSQRKLVIVGDVPYKDAYASRIKQVAIKDDRVIFTGYVTDQQELAELYHNAFVYFHGHEFGGTNPTMLKALAYGSAILALDTPFNREMLQDGKHGIFFSKERGNLSGLVEKMEGNIETVEMLKVTSRNGIVKKYTWDQVVQEYISVFDQLHDSTG